MTLPITSISKMAFVPCNLVTIQVSRLSANVYPKVEPNMPTFERVHTFQVIKSMLKPLPVNTRLILDAIGLQLNCSAILEGLMFDRCNMFDIRWHDFVNLAILLFHDAAGAIIPNTTIVGNLTILLPVLDGPVATCRNEGIRFVRVTCTVDFASLILTPKHGTLILRIRFYINLP